MEFVYDYQDHGLAERLGAVPRALSSALVPRLRVLGQKAEQLIKGTLLTGEVLDRRSGMGMRSIFYRLEDEADDNAVTLVVGADLGIAPYMRVLAYGGTIRPKNGRYLTIPLEAARTPSGVARFSARDVIADPAAHGFSGTFFRDGVLFGSKYKRKTVEGQSVSVEGGKVVPLFALKESVQMPQRNYLAIARDRLDGDIRAAMLGTVDDGLKPLSGGVG